MPLTEETYLWEHWKFNAEQRLKAFNFFVAFSIFANGGVFTAHEKHADAFVFILLGGFVMVLALVFAVVDTRCRHLLRLSKHGLMGFEQSLGATARPFLTDTADHHAWLRFTVAFNLLFVMQFVFGVMCTGYGLWQLRP
jgi:hypothetical protein